MDGVSSHSTGLHPKGTTDLMMPFGDWFGVESRAAALRRANTCRMGRNSIHPSAHLSVHPSVTAFIRCRQSKGSKGQLEGSESL